ncbi:hypothetical protein [Aquimarina sp. I32.4]|uniref:hypothetical protein n=1 Tax=Aquimarina sp. I32.4 TaxID=2053903 RepID=UPI000CDF0C49|nr:hypothetical protein [Aquimarina sp. I32.4]
MYKIGLILFITTTLLYVSSSNAQEKTYELNELCSGLGMNTMLNQIIKYHKQEKKDAENILEYYEVQDTHFTFLDTPIANIKVLVKNKMVQNIIFTFEQKELNAPELSYTTNSSNKDTPQDSLINHRKELFLEFLDQHTPITQKIKKYLTNTYQFISEEPLCQFDCMDIWKSKYAEIYIEKNNYMEDHPTDLSKTTVYIDQTLMIKSTLTN